MSFRVAGSRKCAFAPLADLLAAHGGNGAGTRPDLPPVVRSGMQLGRRDDDRRREEHGELLGGAE
jgi:hypothetical protein